MEKKIQSAAFMPQKTNKASENLKQSLNDLSYQDLVTLLSAQRSIPAKGYENKTQSSLDKTLHIGLQNPLQKSPVTGSESVRQGAALSGYFPTSEGVKSIGLKKQPIDPSSASKKEETEEMSGAPLVLSDQEEQRLVHLWSRRIREAEKAYKSYFDVVKKARQAYKADQKNSLLSSTSIYGAYNIFWSGIETQKPFLYFKRPKLYVERVNKLASSIEQAACKILEKALEWDLLQFDFDSVVKYVRNDYLISGCGVLWEKYCPTFKKLSADKKSETSIDVKDNEVVISDYIDPSYFLIDPHHVGIWEEATWIAKKLFMTHGEIKEQFGKQAFELLEIDFVTQDKQTDQSVCVYEIWDKITKRVYWLALDYPAHFLKVLDDPLKVNGFFPCPKPIFATLTNDSLIPVPDFSMIQQMLEELNGVTERMRLTMQALKVSGVYDSAFHKLGDIFEKDITLVALTDFDKLKSAGGIRGVIDFIPIEQYISALEALSRRREDIIASIFEITGVSDIMRGNSTQAETATAVVKKTNFGTLRNQDRQNDMQRFICDLYRLKAEIICEHFSAETLRRFFNAEEGYSEEILNAAVDLLKSEKMRGMTLHIETEGVLNAEQDMEKTLSAVQSITKMIAEGLPAVSAQPLLLPLYKQMIMAVAGMMPQARLFESVLDQTFTSIEADLKKEQEQPIAQEMSFIERLNNKRMTLEFEIEKEKNALKSRELDIKEAEARAKVAVTDKELALDYQMKKRVADKAKEKSSVEKKPVIFEKENIPFQGADEATPFFLNERR